jgi:hypothetical protein
MWKDLLRFGYFVWILICSFPIAYMVGGYDSIPGYLVLVVVCAWVISVLWVALQIALLPYDERMCLFTRTPKAGWVYVQILPPIENPFEEREAGIREIATAVVVEVLKGYIMFRMTPQQHCQVQIDTYTCPLSEFHKKWRRDKTSKMVSDTSYTPPRDMIVGINWSHTIHYTQK